MDIIAIVFCVLIAGLNIMTLSYEYGPKFKGLLKLPSISKAGSLATDGKTDEKRKAA